MGKKEVFKPINVCVCLFWTLIFAFSHLHFCFSFWLMIVNLGLVLDL